jgi:hypothetical protein
MSMSSCLDGHCIKEYQALKARWKRRWRDCAPPFDLAAFPKQTLHTTFMRSTAFVYRFAQVEHAKVAITRLAVAPLSAARATAALRNLGAKELSRNK